MRAAMVRVVQNGKASHAIDKRSRNHPRPDNGDKRYKQGHKKGRREKHKKTYTLFRYKTEIPLVKTLKALFTFVCLELIFQA